MGSELLLYVWNYNYSSWSMRAGLALRQTGAPFREVSVQAAGADTAGLKAVSPSASHARAHARSMVAEMHSGFEALRSALPMNIAKRYPGFYKTVAVRREIGRVSDMWQACLDRFGGNGPFLFGSFGLADAFFAPIVMRFVSYDAQLSPTLMSYVTAVQNQPFVKDWIAHSVDEPRTATHYDYER